MDAPSDHTAQRAAGGSESSQAPAHETAAGAPPRAASGPLLAFAVIALAAAIFGLRLLAANDLGDNGQDLPLAYALDIVQNHHWLVQWDASHEVASKPPLSSWLIALSTLAFGGFNFFSLALPGALALTATALLLLVAGCRIWDARTGWFAAAAYLLSAVALKQVTLVRADGVFTFTVALAAWLAFRAWNEGKSWMPAWIAAAFATLAKGPLGVLLAGFGLAAMAWERRSSVAGAAVDRRGRGACAGAAAYALLVGGWFSLAWAAGGNELPRKLLVQELFHHAITSGKHAVPFGHVHQPPLYFLAWFAPWSIFVCLALRRIWVTPAAGAEGRRFERFLFCWFLGGLLVFSISPHQRPDLLWPIIPAAALLAAHEISRKIGKPGWARVAVASIGAACLFLFGGWIYYGNMRLTEDATRESIELPSFAWKIRQALGDGITVTCANSPALVQMYLGTYVPVVSYPAAARLVEGPDPAFVVVHDLDAFRRVLNSNAVCHVLAELPRRQHSHTALVSNFPRLERPQTRVVLVDDMLVRLTGIARCDRKNGVLHFVPLPGVDASVQVSNGSRQAHDLRIAFAPQPGIAPVHSYALSPGSAITLAADKASSL